MALSKSIVEMTLAGGLNQHDDKFKTQGMTTAQNVVMNKSGQMNKRNGFTAMEDDTKTNWADYDSPVMVNGSAIYSYKDKLVLAGKDLLYDDDPAFVANAPWYDGEAGNGLAGNSLFSYSEAQEKWMNDPSGYIKV